MAAFEQELIKKIIGGIAAIKRKEKTPKEAGLGVLFTRLKPINIGQYEELLKEYTEITKK